MADNVTRKPTHTGTCCFWVAALATSITVLATSLAFSEQGIREARGLLQEQDQLQRKYEGLLEEKYRLLGDLAEAQALARAYKQELHEVERVQPR